MQDALIEAPRAAQPIAKHRNRAPQAAFKPPAWYLDAWFWAGLLGIISSAGYVIADFSRGFSTLLGADQSWWSDALFVALGILTLLEALGFAASWCQAPPDSPPPRCWPHLTAEALNVLGSSVFGAQAVMYLVQVPPDGSGLPIVDSIMAFQVAGTTLFLLDAYAYFKAWAADAGDAMINDVEAGNEGTGITLAGASSTTGSTSSSSSTNSSTGAAKRAPAAVRDSYLLMSQTDRKPTVTRSFEAASPHRNGHQRSGACRLVLRHCCSVDVCTNLWNIIPSILYFVGALIGFVLHFTRYQRRVTIHGPHGHDRVVVLVDAGQADALKVMSQIYVAADCMYLADAMLVLWAWYRAYRGNNSRTGSDADSVATRSGADNSTSRGSGRSRNGQPEHVYIALSNIN
jgi:hypothetical protein